MTDVSMGDSMRMVLVDYAEAEESGYVPTYYIDYDTGSDSNSGTSSSEPWKHCPGDANATGNANITLSAGNVIAFKGGVSYCGQISVNASGTNASWIVYASGDKCSPQYGATPAIIDGESTRQFGFDNNSKSYTTIDGLEIKRLGAPTADAAGVNFRASQGAASNNTVRYCVIHDVNYQGPYYNPNQGYGIEIGGQSDITMEYNVIYNCAEKLIETHSSGTPRTGGNCQNCIIRYNVLHNTQVHGIVLSSSYSSVYSNIIYSILDGSIPSTSPGFALKVDEGHHNAVYNNIIYTSDAGLGVVDGDYNLFYSNTLFAVGDGGGGYKGGASECGLVIVDGGAAGWTAPRVIGNEFKNNIVYYLVGGSGNLAPKFIYIKNDGGTDNLFMNNLFCGYSGDTINTASRVRHKIDATYYYSTVAEFETDFATWENGTGNIASGNKVADPDFKGGVLAALTNKPTAFSGNIPNLDGFYPNVGSPARTGGLELGSPYNTDIRGVSRSEYTTGAYEYTG